LRKSWGHVAAVVTASTTALGASPRFATARTPGRATVGPQVAALARLLGRPFLPWQAAWADVAGELLPSGRFAYPIVVGVVPRRAGKTVSVLANLCQRAQMVRMGRGWYTAQRREDAAKIFRDEWAPLLEVSPLAPKVRIRKAQGSEGVTFLNARHAAGRLVPSYSKIQLFAPTQAALHAQNADTVVIDEAWWFDLMTGTAIEAGARPAQLTRPLRQTWIISAGGTELSTYLDGWMTAGRAAVAEGATAGICYVEYSADPAAPGYDPYDPAVWLATHPGLGFHIDVDAIAGDITTMDRATFERSYLNVWPRPSEGGADGLDAEVWRAAGDPAAAPGDPVVFGFATAHDRQWSAIAVAGRERAGGRVVVELIERRRGTAWVAAALVKLRAAHRGAPIWADELVGASIAAELARARVDYRPVGTRDYAAACVTFADELAEHRVAHRGQLELDEAVAGCARRNLADAWAWSRSTSTVDICALEAVTVAAWGFLSRPTQGRPEVAAAGPAGGVRR
jgi:hypothetical protein